jgi:type I site-specific restriction-modification system R (restriction) subunit
MWKNKVQAVVNIERSLFDDRPRSLIQMATGSGKTLLAVTTLYRLIKFGGARRVLFLVDRANLGEQAEKEFQGFRTPDDKRLFTELYSVQRLTSNTIGSSSKVVISTIQRLYSILKREPDPSGMRCPHSAAAPDRHLLRSGRQGERPVLRPEAGRERALDEETLDLRLPHEQGLHAQNPADDPLRPR